MGRPGDTKFLTMPDGKTIKPLTEKQLVYVDEYVTGRRRGKPYNKTQAALAAGYSEKSAAMWGSQLFKDLRIKAAIEAHFDAMTMSPGEILARITDIARGEVGDVLVKKEVAPGVEKLDIDPDEVLKRKNLISKFGYDSNGLPKIEFHDAHAALRDLGKARKMFGDSNELSGPNGGPVPVEMVVRFVRPGEALPASTPDEQPAVEEDEE